MTTVNLDTTNESETETIGRRIAGSLSGVRLIYVRGPLGAGKTTFVRGLLGGLGHVGPVKSPTFTLVEPYRIEKVSICHFDLYRISDPEELEFLALRDYIGGDNICVIEWPERAGSLLPSPDIDVMIRRINNEGRTLQLQASTPAGEAVLQVLR